MPKAKRRSSSKAKRVPVRPCTYELGYVRQDLYACRKCTKLANGVYSGFCRGCRETCHADCDGEVFELYTKRNFRCDCGNTRAKNSCLLFPDKEDLNIGNERSYSHNFGEHYCRCGAEYDATLPMAQCAMCEDWFHEDCYRTDLKARGGTDYDIDYEFVCKECVTTLPLLADYYEALNAWAPRKSRPQRTTNVCIRPPTASRPHKPGALDLVWQPAFRLHLCQCGTCMALYREAKALWIVDVNDFVIKPENNDDSDVLHPADDGETVRTAMEAELEEHRRREDRERAQYARDRIPRKPSAQRHAPSDDSALDITSRLGNDDVATIRKRINHFLRDSIAANGGHLDRDAVLKYMSDIKADMFLAFRHLLENKAAQRE